MTKSRLVAFARQNAIALAALFVALGGTGYAAVTINGKNIKNGSIAGKKLKKHTLTGKQINLTKLGTVPTASDALNATTAANATDLGGAPASDYLRTGCGAGRVEGYATINGREPGFPTSYSSASLFLIRSFNCSGGAVEVKRAAAGVYDVDFASNPGTIGFGNIEVCVSYEGPECIAIPPVSVSVTRIAGGSDTGGFQVQVRNDSTGDYIDEPVDVLIT
jgi:hypothetical protein